MGSANSPTLRPLEDGIVEQSRGFLSWFDCQLESQEVAIDALGLRGKPDVLNVRINGGLKEL